MTFLGVLLDILSVRMVLPFATGQSALRSSSVQSNRTRLFGRPTVGVAVWTVAPRTNGKMT